MHCTLKDYPQALSIPTGRNGAMNCTLQMGHFLVFELLKEVFLWPLMSSQENEVWITGIGLVSSLGEGLEAHWQA